MKDALQAAATAAMHRALPSELFAGLLAIAADAVIAVDDEQRIIFFNQGAERIFGFTAAEVGGQYLEILLPERYRPSHRGHVQGFGAAHGHARLMGERQQISGQRKNGEEFPAEAAIQRIELEGRNVYAAVLRDITARQRVEDALHKAIQARDDMMGIVSHDLRNPANAVKMLAQGILRSGDAGSLPAHVVEGVQVMQQAAEQMDALIQDLLDITRIDGGRLRVSPRAVDAASLVTTSIEAMRPLADAGGVALSAEPVPAMPPLRADPDRLRQLLSNLIGNAIKFTPAGGAVTVQVAQSAEGVAFSVHDTGAGIPAAQLPFVFDRFFQISALGRAGGARHGAGLGLPISRGIVEAHGGRIWIESAPGAGTTVRFVLPQD